MDQSFIALGCQTGLWIQEKDQGRWVVRDQEISQISIINDKFFILSCSVLKSYPLQDMMYPGLLEGHLIKSKVFCFQTGILRSQPVVVYVTKKGAQKDLTLTSVTLTPSSGHWLKKYKKVTHILSKEKEKRKKKKYELIWYIGTKGGMEANSTTSDSR